MAGTTKTASNTRLKRERLGQPPLGVPTGYRRDYRTVPVRKMVVMGESNAYGMVAGDPQNEWVQVVAALIRRHQDGYLRVLNNSIPSNVISPDAPGYEPLAGAVATAPSAIERYRTDMIRHQPDLAIYAYGLNDSRCGHPTKSFIRAYEQIVRDTRAMLTEALIVLVGPYWNPQYNPALWRDHRFDQAREESGKFARPGDDLVLQYNKAIARLAAKYECLFVDLYGLLDGAGWLVHSDACHFTDVGHAAIGLYVFTQLAVNASFLSIKSRQAFHDGGFWIGDTGGTNGLPAAIKTWRHPNTPVSSSD